MVFNTYVLGSNPQVRGGFGVMKFIKYYVISINMKCVFHNNVETEHKQFLCVGPP